MRHGRREHPPNRTQARIVVELLDVARQLLDAVDLTLTFDLNGQHLPVAVAEQQIHRTDRCRVLALHELEVGPDGVGRGREQVTQRKLDAVLHKAGRILHRVGLIGQDFLELDRQRLALGVGDDPPPRSPTRWSGAVIQLSGLYAPTCRRG